MELYEALDRALTHASTLPTISPEVFVYLRELYHQDKPTFLPWYDYDRICCDQCYEEILRDDRCTHDWRCIRCAKSQLVPLRESRDNHDRLCLLRYKEMVEALRPLVREEIRQRKRIRELEVRDWFSFIDLRLIDPLNLDPGSTYNSWDISTSTPNLPEGLDFHVPVD